MKIYIAGPMSGIENHNFKAFFAMAEEVKSRGHEPVNPADNDGATLEEAIANQATLGNWAAYMKRDIPRMLECDAVLAMEGWGRSEGAVLEVTLAERLDIPVFWNVLAIPKAEPYVLGLCGYAGSGKDTVAQILVDHYGFERVAFADKLKDFVAAISPLLAGRVEDEGWDEVKKSPSVRKLLQNVGVTARDLLGEDVWVNAALSGLRGGRRYVVTDVRFPNELDAITDRGGETFRVARAEVGPINGHISETALDDYTLPLIENDYSLASLIDVVGGLMRDLGFSRVDASGSDPQHNCVELPRSAFDNSHSEVLA